MRRRQYLQAAAIGLTAGFAGCNDLSSGTTPTADPTPTPTSTDTETPTPTEEPTPRESPGAISPQLYQELLPRPHLKDQSGEHSDNSVFAKMDWAWYLEHRHTSPKWGPTEDENWTWAPTKPNARLAPGENIIKTPNFGAYISGFNVEVGVDQFPNLGPELLQQLGLKAEDGNEEQARVVDEVMFYSTPLVMFFIGADTDPIRDALADNEGDDYEAGDVSGYLGADEASSQNIFVSDEQSKGVVAAELGDAPSSALAATANRLLGLNESVVQEESVRWALSQLVDAPIVTGEINGGRFEFLGNGRSDRGVENLAPYDTLMTSMDSSEFTGTVQTVCSRLDGDAPSAETLRDTYQLNSGNWDTRYHPDVSSISAAWD